MSNSIGNYNQNYLYDLKTGKFVGVKEDSEEGKALKADSSQTTYTRTINGETYLVFDNNIDISNLGNISEVTDLNQLIALFLSGNLEVSEFTAALTSNGAEIKKQTEENGKTVIEFTDENGKSYSLKCNTEAAASQIDTVHQETFTESQLISSGVSQGQISDEYELVGTDVNGENIYVGKPALSASPRDFDNPVNGVSVYQDYGDELLSQWHSMQGSASEYWGTLDTQDADGNMSSFTCNLPEGIDVSWNIWNIMEVYDPNNPCTRTQFLDEQAIFCIESLLSMGYDLGIDSEKGYAPGDIDVILNNNEEAKQYVIDHPEIFHYVFDAYGIPRPDAMMNQYIIDQFKERGLYISADMTYCSLVDEVRKNIESKSSAMYNFALDGNTITITEDTINAFLDFINNEEYAKEAEQIEKYGTPSNWSISGFVKNWSSIMNLFGMEYGDDRDTVAAKLEQFFREHGSTDGKSLNIEDYYNSLSPVVPSYQDIQNYYEYLEGQQAQLVADEQARYGSGTVDPSTFAGDGEQLKSSNAARSSSETAGARAAEGVDYVSDTNGATFEDYREVLILLNFLNTEISESGISSYIPGGGSVSPEMLTEGYTWSYLVPPGVKLTEENWQQYKDQIPLQDIDQLRAKALEKLMAHSCQLQVEKGKTMELHQCMTDLLQVLGVDMNSIQVTPGRGANSGGTSLAYVQPAYIEFDLNGHHYKLAVADVTSGDPPPDSQIITAEEVEELRKYMPEEEFQKVLNFWFTPLNSVDGEVQTYMFSWTGDITYGKPQTAERPEVVWSDDWNSTMSWRYANPSTSKGYISNGFQQMSEWVKSHDIYAMLGVEREADDEPAPIRGFGDSFDGEMVPYGSLDVSDSKTQDLKNKVGYLYDSNGEVVAIRANSKEGQALVAKGYEPDENGWIVIKQGVDLETEAYDVSQFDVEFVVDQFEKGNLTRDELYYWAMANGVTDWSNLNTPYNHRVQFTFNGQKYDLIVSKEEAASQTDLGLAKGNANGTNITDSEELLYILNAIHNKNDGSDVSFERNDNGELVITISIYNEKEKGFRTYTYVVSEDAISGDVAEKLKELGKEIPDVAAGRGFNSVLDDEPEADTNDEVNQNPTLRQPHQVEEQPDTDTDKPKITKKIEDYMVEYEKEVKKLSGKTLIKDKVSGIYYSMSYGAKANMLWNPADRKIEILQDNETAVNDKAKERLLNKRALSQAIVQRLNLTSDPKICCDSEGNYFDYNEKTGKFEPRK